MSIGYLKISKSNFRDSMIIAILAILDINCFYLINIPSSLTRFWGVYQKTLLVVISFAVFIWMRGFRQGNSFLKKYIIGLCFSVLLITLFSTLNYSGNSVHSIIIEISHYFFAFLSIPLLKMFRRQGTYKDVFKIINYVTFILYIVYILQSLIYNSGGPLFLEIQERSRNDALRLSLKSFGNVMILYNFVELWCVNKKKKLFNLIQFVLGIYCLFFIQQTRGYYIAIGLTVAIILLISSKTPLKTLRNMMIILILVVLLLNSGVLNNFIQSFTEGSVEYASTVARTGAFEYFWSEFLENPLFGIGVITNPEYQSVLTGPLGIYYIADVGIVGILAQLGIFGIWIYIYPLLHWCKIVWRKYSKLKYDPFPIALLCYLIFSTPTLICVAPALSFLWPFCFSVFEFINEV